MVDRINRRDALRKSFLRKPPSLKKAASPTIHGKNGKPISLSKDPNITKIIRGLGETAKKRAAASPGKAFGIPYVGKVEGDKRNVKTGLARDRESDALLFSDDRRPKDTTYGSKDRSITVHGGSKITDPLNRLSRPDSFQRGNLDIRFDPSVSPEARRRFLADPVRPTAQIDRFAARPQRDTLKMSSEIARRKLGSSQTRPRTLGELIVANSERKMRNRERVVASGEQRDITYQKGIERQGRSADILDKSRKFELGQSKKLAGYQDELLDPATSPERKAELNRIMGGKKDSLTQSQRLGAINNIRKRYDAARKEHTEGGGDPATFKGFDEWARANTSPETSRLLFGEQAKSKPMDIVNSHPKYKAAYDKASPEEKKAMLKLVSEQ